MIHFLDAWLPLLVGTLAIISYTLLVEFRLEASLFLLLGAELGVLVLWAVYWMGIYPSYVSQFRHLPTPHNRTWMFGNRSSFIPDYPIEDVRNAVQALENNGIIRFYETLSREVLVITKPEALRDMLSLRPYEFGHPGFVKYLMQRLTGSKFSFLTRDGHKHFRKHLRSTFSMAHVLKLAPALWEKAEEMTQLIEEEVRYDPDRIVDLRDYGRRIMWDSFGLTVMGHDFETLRKPNSEIRTRFTQMQPETRAFDWGGIILYFIDLRPILKLLSPILRRSPVKTASNYIRNLARNIVKNKEKKLRNEGFSEIQDLDILSIAVGTGAFPTEELVDHIMLFFTAGPNSTGVVLDWTIYELSRRPEIQKRLREEIDRSLTTMVASSPSEIVLRIQSLPYLNAICSEVIRYYPFIPLSSKVAEQDTTILGERVPKGTTVLVPVEAFNRDKSLWGEDADEFNPDRWLEDGSGGAITNYAMMSFGAGPMACIGRNFARAMLVCFVAALVRRFEIDVVNLELAGNFKPGQFKRPGEGMKARLKVIKNAQVRKTNIIDV